MEFSSDRSEGMSYALNGKVTWSIRNYGLLKQMVKTQKIISSAFRVWEAYLGVNLSKSMVNGAENLSLFLEIKDIEKNPCKCKGMINCGYLGGKSKYGLVKRCDDYTGKIIWKIENFSRLKDILKKKKMKGLCVKSRRFRIGNMEVRILVFPRGQSQKPIHLSTFLEVLDPGNSSGDWSSFIVYQLAVMNGKMIEKSVVKQSAERCSNATKNLAGSEFMTLTSLFDQDSGFIGHETAVFTAEVHILKETFMTTESSDNACSVTGRWKNFYPSRK
ncbi:hypothetical protein NC651_015381 [Populus alba x Populus x berolinensis]|nr:hypothetical protein NC651_015381 [Populus alba x Populus x berolinensis]